MLLGPAFMWALEIQTQVFMCVEQALYLETLPKPPYPLSQLAQKPLFYRSPFSFFSFAWTASYAESRGKYSQVQNCFLR